MPDLSAAETTSPSFIKKHATKLMALVFWLAILGGYGAYTLTSGLSPLESFKQLLDFMVSSPFAPAIFVVLYTLRPLILFSAVLLTLAAGFFVRSLLGRNSDHHRVQSGGEPGLSHRALFRAGGARVL